MELILGANGYLGQYLAWDRRNADCVLHSRSSPNALCAKTGLRFVVEDLVEQRTQLSALDPGTVYLLARPTPADASPLLDFAQNVHWLLQEWADRGCLQRVVFASTQLVYATPKDSVPVTTASLLGPESAYDCHKAEMEFFLSLLAHHESGVRVEVYRLPLLAGRKASSEQSQAQLLERWRRAYRDGTRWDFDGTDAQRAFGNSWVHVDDVVRLMTEPREPQARKVIVQPVSGHFTYHEIDAYFRAHHKLPPQRERMHLPATTFFLADNASLSPRPIAEAFRDG